MSIFPLSTACVSRFKNEACENPILKSVIADNFENLFFIVTEAPKKGFTDREYDFFCWWNEKSNNNNDNKKKENWCLKYSLLVFDYQTSCFILHKTSLIYLLIFCGYYNSISDSVLQITFSHFCLVFRRIL